MLRSQYALSYLPDFPVNIQQVGDEWEVPRSNIIVGMEVSRGNYGQVFRGKLQLTARSTKIDAHRQEMEFEGKSCLTVAVKMLQSKHINPCACRHYTAWCA